MQGRVKMEKGLWGKGCREREDGKRLWGMGCGKGKEGKGLWREGCREREDGKRLWGKACGKGKEGKGLRVKRERDCGERDAGRGKRERDCGENGCGTEGEGRRIWGKGFQFAYKLSACSQQVCSGSSFGGRRLERATGGFLNPFTAPARIISGLKSPHMPANGIFSGPMSNKSTFNIVLTEIFSYGQARTKKGVRISNFALLSFVFK